MKHVDVCILGAGFAGLTLARQLQASRPDLSIVLVEHREFPVPEQVHKVGESTVEIAAHYLADKLKLKTHLQTQQLPKFGLRLFLRGGQAITDDLSRYDEIGVSSVLPIPTFQLDRGRLENYVAQCCVAGGVQLLAGTTVRKLHLSPGAHQIVVRDASGEHSVQARYLVDASGRRAWLRTQQALTRPARHPNHAVWFRIEGELDVDGWSRDDSWQQRCRGTPRRLSTNHFTGPGYWLWLIPLASNATSVGVVFDSRLLSLDEVNTHPRLMSWLAREHPLVGEHLQGRPPLDFHVLKNYAVSASEVFSADGWMLTGDAGVFADPFYSPGADFIAFANGFITELISKDQPVAVYQNFQRYFMAFFNSTLSLYRGQYGGFGDGNMMLMKTIWDYSYYWGPLAKLYFTSRYLDTDFMEAAQPVLLKAAGLNAAMQREFRRMSKSRNRIGGQGKFYDHFTIPFFHQLKNELLRGDSPQAAGELEASVERLEGVATQLKNLLPALEQERRMPPLSELVQADAFV